MITTTIYQFEPVKEGVRKKLTRACVACKSKHHKCTGIHPCSFCVIKGLPCVFESQSKRGPKPKKKSKISNNDNTEDDSSLSHSPSSSYVVPSPNSSSSSSPSSSSPSSPACSYDSSSSPYCPSRSSSPIVALLSRMITFFIF